MPLISNFADTETAPTRHGNGCGCAACKQENDDLVVNTPEDESGAIIREIFDAPGSITTGYTIDEGDLFFGTLGVGDFDFVRFSVTAGETYEIGLSGGLTNPVQDTYLGVLDFNGNFLAEDDDGGAGFYSELTFTATYTGDIFLVADTYNRLSGSTVSDTGSYILSVEEGTPPPTGTVEELAEYLTDGHWEDGGDRRHVFDTSTSNVITVDIASLGADGQALARAAFEAWEMIADIDFVEVNFNADLDFIDTDSGAYSSYTDSNGITTSSLINVSTGWLDFYGTTLDSYSFSTYIHEIGHALGLGHQGDYNGTADYANDATFANDSLQLSIMSYFQNTQNPTTDATNTENLTAQLVDILAVQELYGAASGGVTAGDTTYGEGSDLGNYLDTVFQAITDQNFSGDYAGEAISVTIFDEDGIDTIDLSFDNVNGQVVNLNAGTFSDVAGEVGNVGIAIGTVLENLITGNGDDAITTNAADNNVHTGAGNDTVFAAEGSDTLNGGGGTDRLVLDMDFDDITLGDVSGTQASFQTIQGDVFNTRNFETFEFSDQTFTLSQFAAALPTVPGSVIDGTSSGDTELLGSEGNDTITGFGGSDSITGAAGHDIINAGIGFDTVNGGDGNDSVSGLNGFDLLNGDAGDDTLNGNNGNDTLNGGNGNDLLNGGLGADELNGDAGDDTLGGLSGGDVLNGGTGNDVLNGNAGSDVLNGGEGNDTLSGGLANDTLNGDAGDDQINAGNGSDIVSGGMGDDVLRGNAGNDTLNGDAGNDTLNGGTGRDTFIFTGGNDVILDFEDDRDLLIVDQALLGGVDPDTLDIADFASIVNGDLVLTLDASTSLQFNDVTDPNALLDDLVFEFI